MDEPRPAIEFCDQVPPLGPVEPSSTPGPLDDHVLAAVMAYVEEHRGTYAGFYRDPDSGGTLVVAFTDDPATHRAALRARRPSSSDPQVVTPMPPIEDDRPIGEQITVDVVQATHTEAELHAVTDRLRLVGVITFGPDPMRNCVRVGLRNPTYEVIERLAAGGVGHLPLCIEGTLIDSNAVVDPMVSGVEPLKIIADPDSDPLVSFHDNIFRLSAFDGRADATDLGEDLAAVLAERLERSGETDTFPLEDWRLVECTDERALLVAESRYGAQYASFSRRGTAWVPYQSGEWAPRVLRSVLPPGLNAVAWELDPAFPPPTPEDTVVHVLATEQEGANGRMMGDALRGPEVVLTGDEVKIAFAAEAPAGGQTDQGNPSQAVTVKLPEPLGHRSLVDGLILRR